MCLLGLALQPMHTALVCSLTLLLSDATTAYAWLDGTFMQAAGVLDNSQLM